MRRLIDIAYDIWKEEHPTFPRPPFDEWYQDFLKRMIRSVKHRVKKYGKTL